MLKVRRPILFDARTRLHNLSGETQASTPSVISFVVLLGCTGSVNGEGDYC